MKLINYIIFYMVNLYDICNNMRQHIIFEKWNGIDMMLDVQTLEVNKLQLYQYGNTYTRINK